MIEEFKSCTLCPHMCKVNREKENLGRCRATNKLMVALASLHMYEEPCISGKNGSGTIFFSKCNLSCMYCQNYEISQLGNGKEITIKQLAKIMINLQDKNAENINLVTPTMYVPLIIKAISIARKNGLTIPILYNSNGYENVDTIKKLDGYIDIFLPDFKYYYNGLAKKYSKIENYFEVTTKAILQMYRQVGSPKLNKDGIIEKGLIIRHLVLPNYIENSKNVLKWIYENIDKNVYVSIMAQYFPTYKAKQDEKINRKLTKEEYSEIEEYVLKLGIENGYMQELGEHEEEYVPNFNNELEIY